MKQSRIYLVTGSSIGSVVNAGSATAALRLFLLAYPLEEVWHIKRISYWP